MADARTERTVDQVGQLLRIGTLAVITLVVLGTALVLAAGRRPLVEPGPGFDPARTVTDVVAMRPEGLLWLGILLTVLLPAGRVGLATFGFAQERDRRAVGVGVAVLVVLAVSVLVSIAGSEV